MVLFLYWSMLGHLTLYLLLNENVVVAPPGKSVTLNLRLIKSNPPPPVPHLPDYFADTMMEMESTLQSWAEAKPSMESRPNGSQQYYPTDLRDLSESVVTDLNYHYKSSELDEHPAPVKPVNPVYPEPAAQQGISGFAVLMVSIDEAGRVEHIDVLESNPLIVFGDAAMKAFLPTTFSPGKKGTIPVKSQIKIRVEFQLGEEAM